MQEREIWRACQDCGARIDATGQETVQAFANVPQDRRVYRCDPCREKAKARFDAEREEQRALSLAYMRDRLRRQVIPERFLEARLDTFREVGNEERVRAVREWVREVSPGFPRGYPSLYIASQHWGVGKTHLACGILHHLIDGLEEHRELCPYRFYEAVRLKQRLRATQAFSNPERMEDVYAEVCQCWVLVLDDVGKERRAGADVEFAAEMYYTIVNERYNRGLPMVVTANVPFDEPWSAGGQVLRDVMGQAAVSRLREMTQRTWLEIEGEDRR